MRALAIFALGFAHELLDNTQRRRLSTQLHKITASDAAAYAQFGWSVAKAGDVIVVGAVFFDDIDDHSNQAVYVYRTSDGGATYDEIAKLTAAALAWDSGFGQSVAIDGDTIVVGTWSKATVYIFRIADGGVNEVTTLTPDVAWPENTFGRSVAIDGGTVVVGAWKDGPISEGLAYVFLTSDGGTTYGQVAVLTAGDAAAGDHFGFSVEIDGDTVLVAAQQMPNGGPGAAYIFRTSDGGASYDQVAKLTASDGALDDRFSAFLAIEGGTVVIGAPRDDDAGTNSGSAYVFRTNDGWATYSFVAKLTADDAAAGDYFGKEVEIEDGVVAIGACAPPGIEPSGGEAVYIFHASDDGLTYGQVAKLTAAAPTTIFGSTYVQGGGLGVASYHFRAAGDCYISYENAPPSWLLDDGSSPPAVKTFDSPLWDAASRTFTGVIDWSPTTFGGDARWEYTIVFSEDFRVVSGGEVRLFDASGEQTRTGLFGIDRNASLYADDRFGQSLAMDGGTIVVGAMRDEDAGSDSGSAYVFSLPATPTPQPTAKALGSDAATRAGPLLALLLVAATTVL